MAAAHAPSADDAHPLAAVVHRTDFAPALAEGEFRRYGGGLSSHTRVLGRGDESTKSVGYCVGVRRFNAATLDYLHKADTPRIAQRISINEAYQAEFVGRIQKYLNMSPDYRTADLSGMTFRLAASLAHYACHGTLSCRVIRGGEHIQLQSMQVTVSALLTAGTVFIPQQSSFRDLFPCHVFRPRCRRQR